MIHLLLSFSWLFATTLPPVAAPKSSLKITVQNVQEQQGNLFVAIFKPGASFPQGKPFEGKKVGISGESTTITFPVEPGDYAVAIYHDVNGNGKMDKNMLGIPKEPYGFSTNFKPKMSAPKFTDCQVTVGETTKAISIKLI
ncbi:DUF2141 domain-containing protein [Spirosoma rhododendri]|uniref:DUF2141 domain-containing protein n=1 Tax=Spirosoma rhododendri TaxID=2728024 RepID=A0A7L5DWR1_9BACT|nr:DUF2141 domain-containing protein [Spirosoma rhododendri]QJD81088.1 DUF2141 domain-containing protein [Spirosoma rhododendri]